LPENTFHAFTQRVGPVVGGHNYGSCRVSHVDFLFANIQDGRPLIYLAYLEHQR
jgi:hypothetical protein